MLPGAWPPGTRSPRSSTTSARSSRGAPSTSTTRCSPTWPARSTTARSAALGGADHGRLAPGDADRATPDAGCQCRRGRLCAHAHRHLERQFDHRPAPRLLAWLESSGTDVLCIQETKCTAEQFPADAAARAGLRVRGQRHRPVERRGGALPGRPGGRRQGPARRPGLRGRAGAARDLRDLRPGPRLVGVRAQRPRGRTTRTTPTSSSWFEALQAARRRRRGGQPPVRGAGRLQRRPDRRGRLGPGRSSRAPPMSPPPSAPRWPPCARTGLSDVVPRPLKYDHPYTYWDYRELGFPKNRGMRIDLVYGNAPFAEAVKDATSTARSARARAPRTTRRWWWTSTSDGRGVPRGRRPTPRACGARGVGMTGWSV